MGLFWDLMQQSQISAQDTRASTLEDRIRRLEGELHEARELLRLLITRLEENLGEDLDRDGKVGS